MKAKIVPSFWESLRDRVSSQCSYGKKYELWTSTVSFPWGKMFSFEIQNGQVSRYEDPFLKTFSGWVTHHNETIIFHLGRSPIIMRPSFFLGRSPIRMRPFSIFFYLGRSPIIMRSFFPLGRSPIRMRPLFPLSTWVGHPLEWDHSPSFFLLG